MVVKFGFRSGGEGGDWLERGGRLGESGGDSGSPLRKRSGEDCDLRDVRNLARQEVRDKILRGEVIPYRTCGVKKNSIYSRALGGCSDQTAPTPLKARTDSLRSVSRQSLDIIITSTPKKPKKNSLTVSSATKTPLPLPKKKLSTHKSTSNIFSFEEDALDLDIDLTNIKKTNLQQNSVLSGIGGRLADIDETEEAGFECLEENLRDKVLKLRVGADRYYRILKEDLMIIDENRIFGILLSRGEGGVEHLASDSKFLG